MKKLIDGSMIWQDIVITITSIVLTLSMIPQIYHGFKEKKGDIKYQTSAPTFLGLCVMAYTFSTLSLRFSAIITCLTAFSWFLLLIQRFMYHKSV